MTEPITIDNKQYEVTNIVDGIPVLKPLPKQPEEEKKQYFVVVHEIGDDYLLDSKYEWTRNQAQLAADAVKAVLQYIQGDEPYSTAFKEAVVAARGAITKGESDGNV